MNSFDNLHREFARLADSAPAEADIRASLAERSRHDGSSGHDFGAEHDNHRGHPDNVGRIRRRVTRRRHSSPGTQRRTGSLIAVAAAVVLLAGGAVVTNSLISGNGADHVAGPAQVPPVVAVPDVPLPADTQLVRYRLEPVTSPVSATPSAGLDGTTWIETPGSLAVAFFDPDVATDPSIARGVAPGSADDTAGPVGYTVTTTREPEIRAPGSGDKAPGFTRRSVAVGSHDAVLVIAPSGASGPLGFPATQRLVWQLPDGRWIHVWVDDAAAESGTVAESGASASEVSRALRTFAESITHDPTQLKRTVGIGLSLPGLDSVTSMNNAPVATYIAGMVSFCPAGVSPLAQGGSTASGSGSSTAGTGSASGPDESAAISPGSGPTTVSGLSDPTVQCLTATVINAPDQELPTDGAPVMVGGASVYVDADSSSAMTVLGGGLMAAVRAPASADLSNDDLAALAASVRLSPSVKILPPAFYGDAASEASGSASAVASAGIPASRPAKPGTPAGAAPGAAPGDASSAAAGSEPGDGKLSIDSTRGVSADIVPGTKTATITVWLASTLDHPVTITDIRFDTPRLTLADVQWGVGEDTEQERPIAGAELPSDSARPRVIQPHSKVPVRLEATVDSCAPVGRQDLPLAIEYEYDGGSGGFQTSLPVADYPAWITTLTKPVCG